MRRALTLIELLASLAILALLASALAAWTRTSAEASRIASEELPWRNSAELVLQRIGEDVLVHDESDPEEPRVTVEGQQLVIRTRNRGPVVHEYEPDPTRELLTLTIRRHNEAPQERVLLDRVRDWSCVLDDESSVLTIEFASAAEFGNGMIRRRYHVP